jgi:hypothetical protein
VVVEQVVLGFSGSRLGTIHGFTQRGCTGIILPEFPTLAEFEELNASALAVALKDVPALPQIREKKLGTPVRMICTVTTGLIPNAVPFNQVQSQVPAVLDALPAE